MLLVNGERYLDFPRPLPPGILFTGKLAARRGFLEPRLCRRDEGGRETLNGAGAQRRAGGSGRTRKKSRHFFSWDSFKFELHATSNAFEFSRRFRARRRSRFSLAPGGRLAGCYRLQKYSPLQMAAAKRANECARFYAARLEAPF